MADHRGYLSPDELMQTPLFKAVEAAGGIPQLADALGVSRQAAYVWVRKGGVPLKRAIQIEKLYKISRIKLMDPSTKTLLTDASVTPEFHNRVAAK